MAVRSKQLAAGRLVTAAVFTTVYTVQSGETTLVKSVWLQNRLTVTVQTIVQVTLAGSTILRLYDNLNHLARQEIFLQPWWVLKPGDSLQLQCSGANALNYLVSGAELEGLAD